MSSARKTIIGTLGITDITLAVAWTLVALSTGPSPADSDRSYAKAFAQLQLLRLSERADLSYMQMR